MSPLNDYAKNQFKARSVYIGGSSDQLALQFDEIDSHVNFAIQNGVAECSTPSSSEQRLYGFKSIQNFIQQNFPLDLLSVFKEYLNQDVINEGEYTDYIGEVKADRQKLLALNLSFLPGNTTLNPHEFISAIINSSAFKKQGYDGLTSITSYNKDTRKMHEEAGFKVSDRMSDYALCGNEFIMGDSIGYNLSSENALENVLCAPVTKPIE